MAQENVNVVARIRPLSNETNDETCIKIDPVSSVITLTTNEKQFHMDKIFEQNAPQEEIFEYIQPIIAAVINGIHGTIFAYGQTGSGKTHTMIGSDENHGIIPRSIEMIFIALNEQSKNRKDNFKFKISCTVLQIYCEKTYDLLNGNEKIEIHSRDILKNAKEVEVKSSNECMKILKCGLEKRKVSGTLMNETSSRSHAILTLTLKTEYFKENKKHERISRLNMVDLAGSENRNHTNNNKTQNFEGANINKSLSTLGQVIREIINPFPNQVISYRSSKLTMILRDSLGGNSKTTVIVNIHSNSKYATETKSTLNFAVNVKNVKNTAILQEFITSKETLTLKAEVQRLGGEIDKLKTELGKEKEINQTVVEKVVQLQRIVDEKDNKINTLENETFELEEDKNKLELELKKANEKQKKCEVEIAEMKQMINGLQNENKQMKEKVQALEIINGQMKNQRDADDNYEQFNIDSDCISGDINCGDENEVPVPTDESVPSGKESDSKEKEMPVPMQASPGSTTNQSNIMNVKNYRLGTEYIHGSWVKHLYIFDSDDKTMCYIYTKGSKNYFVCNKCKQINKGKQTAQTVSATIASNENGEECVKLGEIEHVCQRQKFPQTIIYKPDYKLNKEKYGNKVDWRLHVFDSNDKKLYYNYKLCYGDKTFQCFSCKRKNFFVIAHLTTDENGKECCVLSAQKHQCKIQKL
uniref:Kinesin-like protein n=1 Tax=Panagrolaimus davidi TaxID=227884 RepID=A0A914QP04_9BILA